MAESLEVQLAAEEFRKSQIARQDGNWNGGPFWFGWVIREAFVAGVKWENGRCARIIDAEREADGDPEQLRNLLAEIRGGGT